MLFQEIRQEDLILSHCDSLSSLSSSYLLPFYLEIWHQTPFNILSKYLPCQRAIIHQVIPLVVLVAAVLSSNMPLNYELILAFNVIHYKRVNVPTANASDKDTEKNLEFVFYSKCRAQNLEFRI